MDVFVLDRNKLILTLHRSKNCPHVPEDLLLDCGCSSLTDQTDHRQFCEKHFEIQKVKEQTEGRYWSLLLCDACFPQ